MSIFVQLSLCNVGICTVLLVFSCLFYVYTVCGCRELHRWEAGGCSSAQEPHRHQCQEHSSCRQHVDRHCIYKHWEQCLLWLCCARQTYPFLYTTLLTLHVVIFQILHVYTYTWYDVYRCVTNVTVAPVEGPASAETGTAHCSSWGGRGRPQHTADFPRMGGAHCLCETIMNLCSSSPQSPSAHEHLYWRLVNFSRHLILTMTI